MTAPPAIPTEVGLSDYALDVVHHKAQELIGTAGYTPDDLDDIKQELVADLLARLDRFDPARSTYATFVTRLVERKISNLIRYRQSERRDPRREAGSLNDRIDDAEEGGDPQLAVVSQDEHDLRTGKHRRPAAERGRLALDIEAVLADLPADLRRAAVLLTTFSVAETAREMGIPRSTFRCNHLVRLRGFFMKKRLDAYLPGAFSASSALRGVSNK